MNPSQPNPMPTEQEQAAAFIAWRNGATNVEYWHVSEWIKQEFTDPINPGDILRIRPEPVKPEGPPVWYTSNELYDHLRVMAKNLATDYAKNLQQAFAKGWSMAERKYGKIGPDGTPCGVREGEG